MFKRQILVVAALLGFSLGFSPCHQPLVRPSRSKGALSVVAFASDLEDEATYRFYLAKAKECAFSETASALDAKKYLNRILEIESGCMSGILAGHDLCDNVSEVAEVVALLRVKLEEGYCPVALASNPPAALTVPAGLILATAIASTMNWSNDVTPFTLEEWVWAAKGGYLPLMISHFIRNGGL